MGLNKYNALIIASNVVGDDLEVASILCGNGENLFQAIVKALSNDNQLRILMTVAIGMILENEDVVKHIFHEREN